MLLSSRKGLLDLINKINSDHILMMQNYRLVLHIVVHFSSIQYAAFKKIKA